MSEHAAIRKVAEAAVQASESAMVNPHRIIQLLDTIESTESQLSQALRELGEANADAENARGQLAVAAKMSEMLTAELGEARAALASLRVDYCLALGKEEVAHDKRLAELRGALKFIMAFYEPGQTHLDTEAWKVAMASARTALASSSTKET